ncbi:MAG: L,D-transpeptidase [Brevefilum sp.]|nr:L,D-transpeptidase [Brevefilum sp.]
MKRLLLVTILFVLISLPAEGVFAQIAPSPISNVGDDYFGLPLCLPGMPVDGSCLLYGPAQVIAEMKAAGFTYPPRELPAATPPSEMGQMPVFVAKINLPDDQPAPIYASFEDAVAGTNPSRYINRGRLRFVSYIYQQPDANGKTYVMLKSGEWIRATPAAHTNFQGLEFFENPKSDFGWIIDPTGSYTAPSFGARTTGKAYLRATKIQVFETVKAEGFFWYKISPEEWVNSQKARVVTLRPTPPEGVQSNRWIELDLFQQTIMAYEDGQLLFATIMASGLDPFFTQPGVFTIYQKKPLETMQGSFEADKSDFYYLEDVPWTMYYDQARAIHTAYWHTYFGYPQSHGCINLSPGDAKWLFEWAEEGDYVWVHDPSGQTPTDPNYYGPGAP